MAGEDDLRSLVTRARANDPQAWELLYRRAYARLHSYARRRLRSKEEADDAVSEAMTRAIFGIDQFRWRGAGWDAWLYGILRNVVLEAWRQRAPNSAPSGDDAIDEVEDRILADEEARAVRRAFEKLNPEEQELLELRVVAGLDANAVGKVVGKRAGAVRMAQSRALSRLRSLMAGEMS